MKKTNYIISGFVGLVLMLTIGTGWTEKADEQNLSRAVLKIDSLSCGGCFSTINAGLVPLEGYSGMGANLFRKLIAVDFAAPLTAEKISQTLSDIGYPGKLETVDTISQKESFTYLESKRTGFTSTGNGGSCCSGGGSPGNPGATQGSNDLSTQQKGSCCTLPGISQPFKDF